jgi:predicted nucleic acid-binding protein
LSYVPDDVVPAEVGPVLLDTCVYVDGGKRQLPRGAQRLVAGSHLFHSSACIAELTYMLGRLDPAHPTTPQAHRLMRDILAEIRPYRTVAPSRAAYVEAGIITGTLARTQGLGPPDRRKLMLDVLIFLTARELGCPVLTANSTDFDLIQQLAPQGKVLYY